MQITFGKGEVTDEDRCKFFRVIQRYNRAGVTLLEAVTNYISNSEKGAMKDVAAEISKDMRNGMDFSGALRKQGKVFPQFIVEIIHVGEDSGQIAKVLDEIVFYLEQEIDVNREIRQALWTPKAFIIGMVLAFAVALMFVIPKMGELLTEAKVELPMVTQFVIMLGNTAQNFWWLILILLAAVRLAYKQFKKNNPEKAALLILKMPFFREIYYSQMQYRFAKILGLCIVANINTRLALEHTALASDNFAMKSTILRAVRDIDRSGSQAWVALEKADTNKILNRDFFMMLQVGSRTGQLGQILMAEAQNYQKDMLAASRLIGDKVGITVTIPGYLALILLFAAIEYPVIEMVQNMNFDVGGGIK